MALALAVLTQIAAAMLILAGILKLRAPDRGLSAMRHVPLPKRLQTRSLATAMSIAEIATGIAVSIQLSLVTTTILGAWYSIFTLALFSAIRSGAPDCGCFGAVPTRPTKTHLVLNASLALTAFLVASDLEVLPKHPTVVQAVHHQGILGVGYSVTIVLAAMLLVFVPQRKATSA